MKTHLFLQIKPMGTYRFMYNVNIGDRLIIRQGGGVAECWDTPGIFEQMCGKTVRYLQQDNRYYKLRGLN